jgi:hypothetical protein
MLHVSRQHSWRLGMGVRDPNVRAQGAQGAALSA